MKSLSGILDIHAYCAFFMFSLLKIPKSLFVKMEIETSCQVLLLCFFVGTSDILEEFSRTQRAICTQFIKLKQ